MTKLSLIKTLNILIKILEVNKQLISPALLAKAEQLINNYRYNYSVRAVFINLGVKDVDKLADDLLNIVEVEKQLVNTPLTNELLATARDLKDSPIKLALLARLL